MTKWPLSTGGRYSQVGYNAISIIALGPLRGGRYRLVTRDHYIGSTVVATEFGVNKYILIIRAVGKMIREGSLSRDLPYRD